MQQMISLLYLLFLFGVIVTAIFVVYHISKYSLSRQNAYWGNMIFVGILVLLLAINAMIFFQINWDAIVFEPNPIEQRAIIW